MMAAEEKQTGQAGDLTGDGGLTAAANHGQQYDTTAAREVQTRAKMEIAALLDGASPNGTDPATLGTWAQFWQLLADEDNLDKRRTMFDAMARAEPALARLIAGDPDDPEHLTDWGNARRLVRWHGRNLRYCYDWAAWLTWDGRRWATDDSGETIRKAKATVKAMYTEGAAALDDDTRKELVRHALRSENANRISAMLTVAQSEPGIPVRPVDLDSDPWALNVQNGILDLRSGALRPHDPAAMLTKLAPVNYNPAATCPTWEAFLTRVMGSDRELIEYLQKLVGYTLTGDTSEQAVFLFYGTGANGKSTFLETLRNLLGEDYARQIRTETLMDINRSNGPTEDLARLKGARFVSARETEEGKRLAEALVKELSGGDTVTARFLYSKSFEYRPTFKLFLGANHKPVITGTDYAIWRRIHLVPFKVTIPREEQDRRLIHKLAAELDGILAWAVRGCLAWQRDGLGTPAAVAEATAAYRAESDVLAGFLAECCVTDNAKATIQATPLFKAWESWAKSKNEDPKNSTWFGRQMAERGFEKEVARGTRLTYYRGLSLVESAPENMDERASSRE
jgi:putative DNA primase/helicase